MNGNIQEQYITENGECYGVYRIEESVNDAANGYFIENNGYIRNKDYFNISPYVTVENENTVNAKFVVSKILCWFNKGNQGNADLEINKGKIYCV